MYNQRRCQRGGGRTALVVGASRGLGLAAELQRRGWNEVATVRDAAGERRLQELAAKPGGEIRVEHVDINDDAGVARYKANGRSLEAPPVLSALFAQISPRGDWQI
jgi:NAD(P)-dependent dehydrogenase (short-subunit alcohol dehydrogenase family)